MRNPVKLARRPNEREIEYIIIHSSGTMQGTPLTAKDIDRAHKQRGWCGIGYNFVIDLDGKVELGRSIKWQGAHCGACGRNNDSIGICYIGGVNCEYEMCDTRTPQQKLALEAVLQTLKAVWPDAEICGHRDFAATACPSFNAARCYNDITGEPLI